MTLAGHATSVSLEAEFWEALAEIAKRRGLPLAHLVGEIDTSRQTNLSSALRVYVLKDVQRQIPRHGDAPGDDPNDQA